MIRTPLRVEVFFARVIALLIPVSLTVVASPSATEHHANLIFFDEAKTLLTRHLPKIPRLPRNEALMSIGFLDPATALGDGGPEFDPPSWVPGKLSQNNSALWTGSPN
jgi:hypothetical protein